MNRVLPFALSFLLAACGSTSSSNDASDASLFGDGALGDGGGSGDGSSGVTNANGPVACGTKSCDVGEFCQVQPPGIAGPDGSTFPTGYTCLAIPAACTSAAGCACVSPKAECSVASCDDADGGITVFCLGE
jgi:hypothetical protein